VPVEVGLRESHRTYCIRYVIKYVNTERDLYMYRHDPKASGARQYVTDHVPYMVRYGVRPHSGDKSADVVLRCCDLASGLQACTCQPKSASGVGVGVRRRSPMESEYGVWDLH
jgi:hypothetical protein